MPEGESKESIFPALLDSFPKTKDGKMG